MKIIEWFLGLCWKWQDENYKYKLDLLLFEKYGSIITVYKPKFNWIKIKISDIILDSKIVEPNALRIYKDLKEFYIEEEKLLLEIM